MERKGNIALAILAGIGGVLIGGAIYFLVSKLGRIAFVSSAAGAGLSLYFYLTVSKQKKVPILVILLFIALNLFMIFAIDGAVFAQAVMKRYPGATFIEAWQLYPKLIATKGIQLFDIVNIVIVLFISFAFGIGGSQPTEKEEIQKIEP